MHSEDIAEYLRDQGHDVTHVRDTFPDGKAPDPWVGEVALDQDRIVITSDKHFFEKVMEKLGTCPPVVRVNNYFGSPDGLRDSEIGLAIQRDIPTIEANAKRDFQVELDRNGCRERVRTQEQSLATDRYHEALQALEDAQEPAVEQHAENLRQQAQNARRLTR